jgi:ketosteroid isomerase-like protein
MTIAEQYIEAVNAADIERLMGLFAPDAIVRNPTGTYDGRDAIREFYESVVFAGRAITEIERQLTVDGIQVLQIAATSHLAEENAESMHAADVFVIHENRIARLDIYYQ